MLRPRVRGRRRLTLLVASALLAMAGAGAVFSHSSPTHRRLASVGEGPSTTAATASIPAPTVAPPSTGAPTTSSTVVRPAATTAPPATAPPPANFGPPANPGRPANPGAKIVAIDPGHNGCNGFHTAEINRLVPAGGFMKACDTTGTQTNAGYAEAAFNFDVAQRLAAGLRQRGVTVVMTRTSDDGWGPCIDQRAAIGNQAHADAAISIHADGGPAAGRGFHVIEPALLRGYTDTIVAPSHRLALDVLSSFPAGTGMPPSTYIGSHGLDTRGDLGGLNLSQVPKVLVECGNMRNATDAALLSSSAFRQRAADALGAALAVFLGA